MRSSPSLDTFGQYMQKIAGKPGHAKAPRPKTRATGTQRRRPTVQTPRKPKGKSTLPARKPTVQTPIDPNVELANQTPIDPNVELANQPTGNRENLGLQEQQRRNQITQEMTNPSSAAVPSTPQNPATTPAPTTPTAAPAATTPVRNPGQMATTPDEDTSGVYGVTPETGEIEQIKQHMQTLASNYKGMIQMANQYRSQLEQDRKQWTPFFQTYNEVNNAWGRFYKQFNANPEQFAGKIPMDQVQNALTQFEQITAIMGQEMTEQQNEQRTAAYFFNAAQQAFQGLRSLMQAAGAGGPQQLSFPTARSASASTLIKRFGH